MSESARLWTPDDDLKVPEVSGFALSLVAVGDDLEGHVIGPNGRGGFTFPRAAGASYECVRRNVLYLFAKVVRDAGGPARL